MKRAHQFRDLQVTEAEELKLGADVSERVRDRYGVVQDTAVHRYVTLVGTLLVKKSTRPNLPFTFIVLDTDGVNAFAAPGGFIHITRGALGLMANEAELAGVLAHEIVHVTEKHTIKAIQKGKMVQITAEESITKNPEVWNKLVDVTSDLVLAGFGRNEELESDRDGLAMAEAAGYAPGGLGAFLTRLADRNTGTSEKQGLFASHPETKERLAKLDREIKAKKYASAAVLGERYKANISYTARPVTEIASVEEGSAGLAGGTAEAGRGAQEEGLRPRRARQAGRQREEVGRSDRLRRVARRGHRAQREGRAREDDGGGEGEPGGARRLQEGRAAQAVTDTALRRRHRRHGLSCWRWPSAPPRATASSAASSGLSFLLALVYVVAAIVLGRFALSPDLTARVLSVNQLCMALAIINLIVVAPSTRCARTACPNGSRTSSRTRSSSGCS